jgi:hypothetical protein
MGMYDDIVCKYPLPLPEDTKGFHPYGFQTKDLENALDCYEIREDGTLWLRECEREYTDGNPKGKTWSEKVGIVKETKVWWTHVKITKSINMYTYQQGEGEYDYWVEFVIEFVDGVINKITLLKFDATGNAERKENFRLHIEKHKKRKEFESTIFYKLIGKPFNKTIWFIVCVLNNIGSFLTGIGWKLYRKIKI